MIKANIHLGSPKWLKKIENPKNYFNKKIFKLNKILNKKIFQNVHNTHPRSQMELPNRSITIRLQYNKSFGNRLAQKEAPIGAYEPHISS